MKKILSALLLAAVSFLVLLAFGRGNGENMTFKVEGDFSKHRLYHLDDALIPELMKEAPNNIVYEDGVILYPDDFWNITVEKNGERHIVMEDRQYEYKLDCLQLVDGQVYVPLSSITENGQVIDTPLLTFDLDRNQVSFITEMNLDSLGHFCVDDQNIYYFEQDTWLPFVYDLTEGKRTALPQIKPASNAVYSYVEDDRFWYVAPEGDLNAYLAGETNKIHINLIGLSTTDKETIRVPYDEWLESPYYYVHDGWLYYFCDLQSFDLNNSSAGTAALYRRNMITLQEECVCEDVFYDQSVIPEVTMGQSGLVYRYQVWDSSTLGYVHKTCYIPYDGWGMVELNIPE